MNTSIDLQFEAYTLVEELSQNEIMTVYRAERQTDNAPVIVKVLSPLLAADEFLARRFKLAAQQMSKLEHPNIVRSYEAGQEGDRLYWVQDFIRATPLAQVLHTEGSFAPQRMQFIARQLASALDYAHQKSYTHGNLSAHCVFLGPDDRVWLADFGLTQALFGLNILKQNDTMSQPETMAPERVHGQGPSRHSDLYALGILCYQMLTGKPPFTGSPSAVLHAQAYQQPRPLYRLNPGIPVAVSEVIGRMLSKGLELRYNTGAEFARALSVACSLPKNFPTHGFEPVQPHPAQVLKKWLSYAFSAGLVILLIAAALVWVGYQWGLSQRVNASQVAAAPVTALPAASPTSTRQLISQSELEDDSDSLTLVVTPTPTVLRAQLADALPTATFTPIGQRPPTATPAPVIITPTPPPAPTAAPSQPVVVQPAAMGQAPSPVMPAGMGLLVFHNPTGYDLIVDLTGPSSASQLIPPYKQHEFALAPGRYQCMVHTPTGQGLDSRVLNFDIVEGQTAQKDYYTDYDLAQR
jgi:serine/threonine-protein kinase